MTDPSKVKTTHDLFSLLYKGTMDKELAFVKWYPLADHEQLESAFRGSCTEIVDLRQQLKALKEKILNTISKDTRAETRLYIIKELCEEKKE